MATLVAYRAVWGVRTDLAADAGTLRDLLEDPDTTLWLHFDRREDDADPLLEGVFGFHALAIEDMWSDRPAPKIEDFRQYLFLTVHGIDQDADRPDQLDTVELDVFLGPNYVVSHASRPMRSVDVVREEIEKKGRIVDRGAVFVAHALLDHLTDHYLPVMDRFDEAIDALEDEVVLDARPESLQRIFVLKRNLMKVRRVAVHQKDILLRLSRGEFDVVPERALPFFRDVYDHFVRVADLADSYRDTVASALDAYLSTASNRMNQTMKMLTGISTVMLPLSFVAAVWGMNFAFMPELKWRYGYLFAWGIMITIAVSMIVFFKKRKWF